MTPTTFADNSSGLGDCILKGAGPSERIPGVRSIQTINQIGIMVPPMQQREPPLSQRRLRQEEQEEQPVKEIC
jgi:hypothetical protein